MARRDLEVRVRADVGAYQKAMSSAVKATDQFGQSALRAQKVGLKISGIGDTLTRRVTLPLGLAGAAATKMALDFDKAFVTMQTLAGVSAGEVDHLKESVMDLAGQTGRAPQELAEALYFLQSSGLDSAQAMDALEVSAKASAAGMGETQVIADAVSSAMLGYAQAGLTAAEATDVLVATARAGKAEPAELAGQMGRLVPIASELGITFGDVGGAIAALSTKGNNAEQATTQLTNVMSKLLKPSQMATKALEEVGLSTDAIREMIAEKGLLGTLEELKARLGDNGFIKFFEDQQAVQGALALLGGDLEATKAIFDEVNGAVGATDEAFGIWAESMGAKNAKAFAQFQVALIRIGDVIAPIATDVLNFASMILEAFSKLPSGAQTTIVVLAAVAAAAGPLLSVGGRLITLFGTVARMMTSFAVPAGSVAGAFNSSGVAAGGAASGIGKMGIAMRALPIAAAIAGAAAYAHSLSETVINADKLVSALASQDAALRKQAEETVAGLIAMDEFDAAVEKAAETNLVGAERLVEYAEAAGLSGDALQEVKDIINEKREADVQAAADQQTNAAAIDDATGAIEDQAGATEEATSALQEYSDTLKAMTDPVFAAMDAITGVRDAQVGLAEAERGVLEAQVALDEAIQEHGANSSEAAEAARGLEDAERGLSDAQWATVQSAAEADSALAGLKDAVDNGDVSMDTFKATLAQWVDQGFLTQSQADRAARSVAGLADEAEEADRKRVDVPVSTPGSETSRERLRRVKEEAFAIPKSRNVNVTASGYGNVQSLVDRINDKLGQLRDRSVTVRTNFVTTGQGGSGGIPLEARQHGGPVAGGRLYEVAEQGRAELLEMGGRTYLIPGANGTVVPASMFSGGGGAGTSVLEVRITGSGALAEQVQRGVRNGDIQLEVDGKRVGVRR